MKIRTGSGRLITVTTNENAELVEELICLQEDFPGTHKCPREIARNVGISRSLVRRLVKRRTLNQLKRKKTSHMNNGTRERRTIRSGNLAERFDRNPRLVEKFAYQDEKDFALQVPTNIQSNRAYFKGKKDQVPDENLFHQKNKQSIKVMVSASLTWNGVTKPFFVNGCGVKMNINTRQQRHTSNIYRKNFYLPFNTFINIKIGLLYKAMHHHTVRTSYKIFYKKHSIHVLSKLMNGPRRHLISIPSITIFGIKWTKRYMKIDLTSRLKTRKSWRSRSKVYGMILPSVYQRFEEQSKSLLED